MWSTQPSIWNPSLHTHKQTSSVKPGEKVFSESINTVMLFETKILKQEYDLDMPIFLFFSIKMF